MDMRIALSGAEQPIGRAVRRELERHAVDVTPFDTANADSLQSALEHATHVVHAASMTDPGQTASAYADANVHATTTLLDACRQRELAQVLMVSTTETYGRRLPPWPVNESWVPRPLGPALQSRVAAERAARTYRRRVPLSILRAAPVITEGGGLMLQLLRHFTSRPRAALVAGGDAPISVLAGADLGRAVWAALSHAEAAVDQVFHATSAHTSWGELARESCQLQGVEARFWSAPYLVSRALRTLRLSGWVLPEPDGVDGYVDMTGRPHLIDDARARVALEYEPVLGVRASIAQALDVYRRGASADASSTTA